MKTLRSLLALAIAGAFLAGGLLTGTPPDASAAKLKAQVAIPKKYEGKHMPEGGWTNEKMIARGKEVYTGKVNKKSEMREMSWRQRETQSQGRAGFPESRQYGEIFGYLLVFPHCQWSPENADEGVVGQDYGG